MAIGSTIASKLRTDEFDIDVIAQLGLPQNPAPSEILDMLFQAIRGDTGSRYYKMAKRRTRCVTVDYSDDMHLDVTPMLRRWCKPEREGELFHHRPEAPSEPGDRLIANPYGFAEWFKKNTPPDAGFAKAYASRSSDYERMIAETKADAAEPVPAQVPPIEKSRAVIVLQLLKRWRNVQYDTRSGRRPPSILISKLVADGGVGASRAPGLAEELLHQATHLLSEFEQRRNVGKSIHVVNPVCDEDMLTDRWPKTLAEQGVFVKDLRALVTKVKCLIDGCSLDEMRQTMVELFGEAPTLDAFRHYVRVTSRREHQ